MSAYKKQNNNALASFNFALPRNRNKLLKKKAKKKEKDYFVCYAIRDICIMQLQVATKVGPSPDKCPHSIRGAKDYTQTQTVAFKEL